MKLINIHRHGILCQQLAAATSSYEILKAATDYIPYMNEVNDDMMNTHYKLEGHVHGKTINGAARAHAVRISD